MARVHPRPRGFAAPAVAVALAFLAGCESGAKTVLTGQAVAAEDVAKLTFGRSTADDVERIFGHPDERAADGSLVYRATELRRSAHGVGILSWDEDEVVGEQVSTFRFTAGGVLSQLCRERS